MYSNELDLNELAAEASRGDPQAQASFRKELVSRAAYIVGHVLNGRESTTPMKALVLAEAKRLGGQASLPTSGQRPMLIAAVARRLCENVLAKHCPVGRPRQMLVDTVRM